MAAQTNAPRCGLSRVMSSRVTSEADIERNRGAGVSGGEARRRRCRVQMRHRRPLPMHGRRDRQEDRQLADDAQQDDR